MRSPERIELKGFLENVKNAPVVELADTDVLGTSAERLAGSSPVRSIHLHVAELADASDLNSDSGFGVPVPIQFLKRFFNERIRTLQS